MSNFWGAFNRRTGFSPYRGQAGRRSVRQRFAYFTRMPGFAPLCGSRM